MPMRIVSLDKELSGKDNTLVFDVTDPLPEDAVQNFQVGDLTMSLKGLKLTCALKDTTPLGMLTQSSIISIHEKLDGIEKRLADAEQQRVEYLTKIALNLGVPLR